MFKENSANYLTMLDLNSNIDYWNLRADQAIKNRNYKELDDCLTYVHDGITRLNEFEETLNDKS